MLFCHPASCRALSCSLTLSSGENKMRRSSDSSPETPKKSFWRMDRQLLTQRLLLPLTAACIGAALTGPLATAAYASANQAPIIPVAQTSASICGNNVCESGESCASCTHDCCPENETTNQPPPQQCDPNVPCDNDG